MVSPLVWVLISVCMQYAFTAAHLCHQITEICLGSISNKHGAACPEPPVVQPLIRAEQHAVTVAGDVPHLYPMEKIWHLREEQ